MIMDDANKKMNTKKNSAARNITAVVFLIFIAALTALNLLWPDSDFSPDENRMLAGFPKFSLKALFLDDDKWTLKFEDYATDQFPLRSKFVGIKAASERALLKSETGGVYFAQNDTLIERPKPAAFKTAVTNVSAINTFAQTCGVPVTLALIPNSVTVNSNLLPPFAYDGEQSALIAEAYKNSAVPTVDIASALDGGNDLFYRTDHHPTAAGAYRIYSALSPALSYTPVQERDYNVTRATSSFRGTAFANSGAWWVEPDAITLYSRPDKLYTLTTVEGDASTVMDGLYDMERLKTADEYTVFLGGNHPLQVIRGGSGKKLLLLKDSFSHCVAPLLCEHFLELHLIDMRYYRGSVHQYIKDNRIDAVLIMYSAANFTSEKNLLFLNNS